MRGAYRPSLQEALRRAQIPARFNAGTERPDPAGRGLLALLDCRREGYSARAFGEYLSLAVVPGLEAEGAGTPPPAQEDAWLPPDDALFPFDELEEVFQSPRRPRAHGFFASSGGGAASSPAVGNS